MSWFVRLIPPNYSAFKETISYYKYLHTVIIIIFFIKIFVSREEVPLNSPGIFGCFELIASFGLNIGEIAILVYFVTSRAFLHSYEWMNFSITFILFLIGKTIQSQTNTKMESEFHKNVTFSNYGIISLYYEALHGNKNSTHEFQNQTNVATKSQNTRNDDLVNLPFLNVVMHVLFALLFSYLYRNSPPPTPEDTEQGTSQVLHTSSSIALSNLSGPSAAINSDIIFSQDHRVQVAVQPIHIPTSEELRNQDAQISDPLLQPAQISDPLLQPAQVDVSSNERTAVDSLPGPSRNDPAQVISPDDESSLMETVL